MFILNQRNRPAEFDESKYLEANNDVYEAVQRGEFFSGWQHFAKHGFSEGRPGVSHRFQQMVGDLLQGDSLVPPESLHNVGAGDYIYVGEHILGLLVSEGGLKPEDRILDVGCGTGRIARSLTRYLTHGSYDGIDIVRPSIEWCQEAYRAAHPTFHFHTSDVYNRLYNPEGKFQARDYQFPFDSESFDFVFLTSVFTHMLPAEMENYFAEVTRVLKKGATCFITFFLINDESLHLINQGVSTLSFQHQLDGCWTNDSELPESAIAYAETAVRQAYQRHDLSIQEPIRFGRWCRRKQGMSYQDIVIAKKEA